MNEATDTASNSAGPGAPEQISPAEQINQAVKIEYVDITDTAMAAVDQNPVDQALDQAVVVDLETTPEIAAAGDQEAAASSLNLADMPSGARGAIEAVLMILDEPVNELSLGSALGLTVEEIRALLIDLVDDYDRSGRGFELREVAGGWRIFSRADYAPVVESFMLDGQTAKLTQAALETLAIVAYRQPVSRARVGAIRGVNVDAVMRTLLTRGLVEETGHDGDTGAVLYSTTQYFLQRLGLTSLDQLPALAPFLPEVDALEEFTSGGVA